MRLCPPRLQSQALSIYRFCVKSGKVASIGTHYRPTTVKPDAEMMHIAVRCIFSCDETLMHALFEPQVPNAA